MGYIELSFCLTWVGSRALRVMSRFKRRTFFFFLTRITVVTVIQIESEMTWRRLDFSMNGVGFVYACGAVTMPDVTRCLCTYASHPTKFSRWRQMRMNTWLAFCSVCSPSLPPGLTLACCLLCIRTRSIRPIFKTLMSLSAPLAIVPLTLCNTLY